MDDLRKILPGCQQMASIPNGVETSPKINRLSRAHERYRQTDRQTTDRRTADDIRSRSLKIRIVLTVDLDFETEL